MIRFTWLEQGGRKMRLVGGVGVVLRFEAEASTFLIRDTAFAGQGTVEEIACVKLDAWLGGPHFQGAAGRRIVSRSGKLEIRGVGISFHDPTVVVATSVFDLSFFHVDVSADGFGSSEIQRAVIQRGDLSCGDEGFIHRDKAVGIDRHFMVEDGTVGISGQVEIGMVGQVDVGGPVGRSTVVHAQLVPVVQGVIDLSLQGTGVAFIAVGTGQLQS